MTAEAFLSRLDRVRRSGRRPVSLAIRELPDGRTLVHCFAGCEVADVSPSRARRRSGDDRRVVAVALAAIARSKIWQSSSGGNVAVIE